MKLFGRMMVFVSMLALIVSAVAFTSDDELPGDCGDECTCEVADCCGDCHSEDCTCDCKADCDCEEDCGCDEDCGSGHTYRHGYGDSGSDEDTGGHCGGCH